MKCEDIRELLSTYIDKELPEDEARWVEAHLLDCAGCADALSGLEETVAEVGKAPGLRLPPAATARLAAAVDAHLAAGRASESKPASRRQWFARPAFVSAAAAVGAAAFAVVIWQGTADKTERYPDTPSKQEAPAAQERIKSYVPSAPKGSDFPHGSDESGRKILKDTAAVFTKKRIDELAEAGGTPEHGGQAQESAPSTGLESAKIDEALEAGVSLAASNRPATLVFATQGLFEDRLVWIVVVELNEGAKRVGAAVALDNGRLLYRTKQ